jgi:tetratricopeptide (TPR) repeat protein
MGATTRPSIGGGNRPNIGGDNRPGGRPDGIRPDGGGKRPDGGLRPDGGRRPDGGLRPDSGRRPDGGLRPDTRPSRPIINNGNIHTGDNNFIGNRPGWDHGNWNRPGWGWGNNNWAGNWHDHCINHHHGWYNGCWHGYWESNWYAPLAWGAVGWGLGSWTSGWGYGTDYYNPYYTEPVAAATVPYDYSQPVVVNNYYPDDTATTAPVEGVAPSAPAAAPSASDQATQIFDEGLAQFKTGDYTGALAKFDAALQKLPGDPVVHEVRAVTLFALGDYKQSAAALNSFLSSAPGMDWTTMSSLYGDPKDYEAQLRKLEQFCRSNPNDAAAYFVLAYQYLVLGSKDPAINALKVVVKNQPKDATAKRMLDALSPPAASAPPAASVAASDAETDLVGNWQAKAGGTTIDLAITEDSQFTWKALQPGQKPVELKGQLESGGGQISLDSADQGAMAGTVKSLGPDKWQFNLNGAPASDPGLIFARSK